jgi:D-citramalate synthase
MSAVDAGVDSVHCTINCLGERAGNASLAEIAVVLRDKMNIDLNIDESHIVSVSQMVESFSGKFVASNTPILGSDVFTQTAGIHADGDVKGNLYVSRLYPERFARKRTYALGKMSGKASLQKNLDEIGVSLSSDEQQRVLDRIVELGDSKQRITSDDLPFIIADVLESDDFNHLSLINCDLKSEWNKKALALLTLEINGNEYSSKGEGNGGFDAFVCALVAILDNLEIKLPVLLDYKVHIPKGGQTNALTEASITWQFEDNKKTITTRGMHANQVFAAIEATLRLVNKILHDRN